LPLVVAVVDVVAVVVDARGFLVIGLSSSSSLTSSSLRDFFFPLFVAFLAGAGTR